MPRNGAIIFGDLTGKLDVLRIECPKCGRSGRYKVPLLVVQYGRMVFTFLDEIAADGPRKLPTSMIHARRNAWICRRCFDTHATVYESEPGAHLVS
jgi:hypothetical protein